MQLIDLRTTHVYRILHSTLNIDIKDAVNGASANPQGKSAGYRAKAPTVLAAIMFWQAKSMPRNPVICLTVKLLDKYQDIRERIARDIIDVV